MDGGRSSVGPAGLLLLLREVGNGEDGLSSTIELRELVASPGETLGCVVFETGDGTICIGSLFDVSLVAFVHVVMEGIFEG